MKKRKDIPVTATAIVETLWRLLVVKAIRILLPESELTVGKILQNGKSLFTIVSTLFDPDIVGNTGALDTIKGGLVTDLEAIIIVTKLSRNRKKIKEFCDVVSIDR